MSAHTHHRARRLLGVLLPAALFAASCLPAGALDLSAGRIRLTLYEGTGRFSLACQARDRQSVYVPLLAAQDPRTTVLSIVVGNKVYRMGESSEFSEAVEKTPSGGRFVWKSTFLQVTESFSFITSQKSTTVDGLRIDLTLRDLSEQDLTVGVRYLFDTYLGESSFVHFRTDTLSQVTRELTIAAAQKPLYWVSPLAGDADEMGLEVMTSGAAVTVPDSIVFANWKRLSDAAWTYETSSSRNFSLLPYSVNDSAVGQYYAPRTIPKDGELTITLILGKYSKDGFAGTTTSAAGVLSSSEAVQQQSTSTTGTAATTVTAAAPSSETTGAARDDLSTVNDLLTKIQSALAAGGTITDDDLRQVESALRDLETRAAQYSPAAAR